MQRKFNYLVQLQRSDGEIIERPYSVLWSPEKEDSAELVARSCAAEATVFEGKKEFQFAGLTAVLQA